MITVCNHHATSFDALQWCQTWCVEMLELKYNDLAFFPAIVSFPAAAPKQGRHWVKFWTPCAQLVETEEGRFVETETWRNGNHPHVVAPAKWCMRLGRVSLSVSSFCPEGAPFFFWEPFKSQNTKSPGMLWTTGNKIHLPFRASALPRLATMQQRAVVAGLRRLKPAASFAHGGWKAWGALSRYLLIFRSRCRLFGGMAPLAKWPPSGWNSHLLLPNLPWVQQSMHAGRTLETKKKGSCSVDNAGRQNSTDLAKHKKCHARPGVMTWPSSRPAPESNPNHSLPEHQNRSAIFCKLIFFSAHVLRL